VHRAEEAAVFHIAAMCPRCGYVLSDVLTEERLLIRRTKIVATLGPRTCTPPQIAALIEAGANVIRINASHGTPAERGAWMAEVRRAAERAGLPVAVLVDLQGPRIRVGELSAPRVLQPGDRVVFAPEGLARGDEVPTTYAGLAADVRPGARILLDDGLVSVEVTAVAAPRVEGRVVDGGTLTAHKGMNLPGLHVSAPALTEKDREDVAHAVAAGADYLALSFVRRAEDLVALRDLVPPSVKLVAKIERATALEDLERILAACDAVMVARGDLGVELPFEEVPVVQKRLIRDANRHGKPVITATQMLESMVQHPRPTRAEASDVANAILDGTDAVMLSAETAVGAYPLEAVRAMDRIIRATERHRLPGSGEREDRRVAAGDAVSVEDAIALGTSAVARMLRTPLIVTLTKGGFTARKVAALRPPVPILAVTTEPATYRQLALVWGVTPVLVDRVPGYDAMLAVVRDLILRRGYARPGDRIVMTAGVPWEVSGTTNLLKVEVV
jgi:pyruvate kinase